MNYLRIVLLTATLVFLPRAGWGENSPDVRIKVLNTDDGETLAQRVMEELPMKHRYRDPFDRKILRVIDPPLKIIFELPPNPTTALEELVDHLIKGDHVPGAPYILDFSRVATPLVERGSHGIPGASGARPGFMTPAQFPNERDQALDAINGGLAPGHMPYLIVKWDEHRDNATNALRTLDKADRRRLLHEPSYEEILVDDRLVPVPRRADFQHELESMLGAGLIRGWAPKFPKWRSDDPGEFEALKAKRVARATCLYKLES